MDNFGFVLVTGEKTGRQLLKPLKFHLIEINAWSEYSVCASFLDHGFDQDMRGSFLWTEEETVYLS